MSNDFHAHDEVVYAAQLEAYYRAGKGWGVISALTPAQRGAGANMSIDIGAGEAYLNGTAVSKGTTTNLVVAAADATKDRTDIATLTSAGVLSVAQGNLESDVGEGDDYPPVLPDNSILLALVKVQGGATSITTSDITDKRIFNTGLHDPVNGHDHDGEDSKQTTIFDTTKVFDASKTAGWSDLVLSPVIGSNSRVVFLLILNDSGGSRTYRIRRNGFVNEFYDMITLGNGRTGYLTCPTDTNGVVEWLIDTTGNSEVTMEAYW